MARKKKFGGEEKGGKGASRKNSNPTAHHGKEKGICDEKGIKIGKVNSFG